jgi:predicted small secreted protein
MPLPAWIINDDHTSYTLQNLIIKGEVMGKKRFHSGLFIGVVIVIILVAVFVKAFIFSAKEQANSVVEEFYTHEQEGDFTKSWELFHPFMKEKWDKPAYINDRAHVFMGHFGAETFDFTIEYVDQFKEWKMSKDHKPIKGAYKFHVLQTYKGKYGKFNFEQDVFVVENKNKWQILWDYNQ